VGDVADAFATIADERGTLLPIEFDERFLRERGDTCLRPGDHVVHHLDSETAAILVLASEPYAGSSDS
jgi:hypothetical protein